MTPTDDSAILAQARAWQAAGDKVVLALVTAAWGSAPRRVGAVMAVREDGLFCGSVSGGCVEAGVVAAAEAMGEDETLRRLSFGITELQARAAGLPCGGTLGVALIRPAPAWLDDLCDRLGRRDAVVVRFDWADGAARMLDGAEAEEARARAPAGGGFETEDGFVQVHAPPVRLLIVGAVHLAQALAAMAGLLGFEVMVVDPRRSFATSERFPGIDLLIRPSAAVFDEVRIDSSTAIVALAHQSELDDPALLRAISSPAFYVGVLGSRRTHAKRCQRLAGLGALPAQIERMHAPVGLDIGAVTPAEIAVAIAAEIVAARHGRDPRATGVTASAVSPRLAPLDRVG